MPTAFSSSRARAYACLLETSLCSTTASASWRPILCTGFSDVMGSWKIIAISSPRIVRRRLDEAFRRSSPRNSTSPVEVANFESLSPITVRHVTLFPDPDSPTMPSTCPGSTLKLTPSTAFDDAVVRLELGPQVADVEEGLAHRAKLT